MTWSRYGLNHVATEDDVNSGEIDPRVGKLAINIFIVIIVLIIITIIIIVIIIISIITVNVLFMMVITITDIYFEVT